MEISYIESKEIKSYRPINKGAQAEIHQVQYKGQIFAMKNCYLVDKEIEFHHAALFQIAILSLDSIFTPKFIGYTLYYHYNEFYNKREIQYIGIVMQKC